MDYFFFAVRKKVRFETGRGNISVEDVCDLPLTAEDDKLSIDLLGKAVTNAIRDNEGNGDFVAKKEETKEVNILKVKLKILERIRDYKIERASMAEKATLTKAKKQKLVEILEKKRGEDLESHTTEEIEAMIADL